MSLQIVAGSRLFDAFFRPARLFIKHWTSACVFLEPPVPTSQSECRQYTKRFLRDDMQAMALSYPSYRNLLAPILFGFTFRKGHPYEHIIIRCESDELQRLIILANRIFLQLPAKFGIRLSPFAKICRCAGSRSFLHDQRSCRGRSHKRRTGQAPAAVEVRPL